MNTKRSSLSGLKKRLYVTGIPTFYIDPFARIIEKWIVCSGEQWTVSRLKTLKLFLVTSYSGHPIEVNFAKNRHGEIKGIVGSLIRYGLKSDKHFIQVLSAFMAYTNWTSTCTTEAQLLKFKTAVNACSVEIPNNLRKSLVRTTQKTIGRMTVSGSPTKLLLYRGSPNKRSPTMQGPVKQNETVLKELLLLNFDSILDHVKRHSSIYDEVFTGIDWRSYADSVHQDEINTGPMIAGEVHFLQEPGYKLRSIASPFRLFQLASEPIKKTLKSIVYRLPWDCTHDQNRATTTVQKLLSEAKIVHSVDLSSATDYFPLSLQMIVLETIFGPDSPYVSLVHDICTSEFKSEIGSIKWNRGQPLGFGPSFFLFTLTHGLLLQSLSNKPWNGEFFVVGDDVIITDNNLYYKYIKTLCQLGCPYAPEKSISSNKLAEFAGRIISPKSTFPQLKWRHVSDDNFIDLARHLGPRIKILLSKRQKQTLEVFAHVSPLVHPYGLNWSYPGSNLKDMIEKGLRLTFEDTVIGSLTGLSRQVNNQLFADYGPRYLDYLPSLVYEPIIEEISTFDEKVIRVFKALGYARNDFEYFLELISDIPSALSSRELPLEDVLPSRRTLLNRLSGFLRNN